MKKIHFATEYTRPLTKDAILAASLLVGKVSLTTFKDTTHTRTVISS